VLDFSHILYESHQGYFLSSKNHLHYFLNTKHPRDYLHTQEHPVLVALTGSLPHPKAHYHYNQRKHDLTNHKLE